MELQTKLQKVVKLYYGLNFENLDPDLFRLTISNIINRFEGITFQDIDNAFEDTEITKKEGVSLTKNELLAPIVNYWKKKHVVKSYLSSNNERIREAEYDRKKSIEFKRISIELYLKCINEGTEWTGTIYQSTAIAKDCLSQQFGQQMIKEVILPLAKEISEDFKLKIKQQSVNGFESVIPNPTKEQIYSHAMVITACNRKTPILI